MLEGLSSRARSLVQSLANDNQALKQQIQALQADLKAGITKAHLAAAVKAHDTETMSATKIHDTEVRAHTAIAVEEIKAAGKLLDSHVEHGHEAAMLERQLTRGAIEAEQGKKPNGEG